MFLWAHFLFFFQTIELHIKYLWAAITVLILGLVAYMIGWSVRNICSKKSPDILHARLDLRGEEPKVDFRRPLLVPQ